MAPEVPLRVAILWKQLAGYSSASFRALAADGIDLHLVYREAISDAPFDDTHLAHGFAGHHWTMVPDEDRIRSEISAFAPHALLVISWDVGAYRRIAREMRGRTLRILCMDNQWLATMKQRGGVLMSRALIRPTYDAAFLPGERQAVFATRLGFTDERILSGLYTCDYEAFRRAEGQIAAHQRSFVFAGRLAYEKGVDVLARAYARYRSSIPEPWTLVVCGTGPLMPALADIPGVDLRGFVPPADLPSIFQKSSCLVLPSRFEPWGVVIHEAAASGLAIVCTTACGASSRLVLDGYNGAVVPPNNVEALAAAMSDISCMDAPAFDVMRMRSMELSKQFTPERWAQYLVKNILRLRSVVGLPAT